MSMTKKVNSNSKRLLLLLSGLPMLFLIGLVTYSQFQPKLENNEVIAFEAISTEKLFQKNFQPPTADKIIKTRCTGIEGCILVSPIKPNTKLERASLVNNKIKTEDQGTFGDFADGDINRSKVYYDPHWKIYWVYSEGMSFYGPYKLSK
jgi:hypothetical protein